MVNKVNLLNLIPKMRIGEERENINKNIEKKLSKGQKVIGSSRNTPS